MRPSQGVLECRSLAVGHRDKASRGAGLGREVPRNLSFVNNFQLSPVKRI